MDKAIKRYLAEIGQRGGKKSRRRLTTEQARAMVQVREAKSAFRRFRASCFWSFDPDYEIKQRDVLWVAEQLSKYGNREAYRIARKLCR